MKQGQYPISTPSNYQLLPPGQQRHQLPVTVQSVQSVQTVQSANRSNIQGFQSPQVIRHSQVFQSPKSVIPASAHAHTLPQNATLINPQQLQTMTRYLPHQELLLSPARRQTEYLTTTQGQNIRNSHIGDISVVQQHQQKQKIVHPQNHQLTQQHKNHKFEQTLQVVDLRQYQEKWQKRITELEDQIRGGGARPVVQQAPQQQQQPQQQIQQQPQGPVYFEDETKLKSYLQQMKQLDIEKSTHQIFIYIKMICTKTLSRINTTTTKERMASRVKYHSNIQSAQLNEQQREIAELRATKKAQENEIDMNNNEFERLESLLSEKEAQADQKDRQIAEHLNKIKDLQSQLIALQKSLDSLQSDYNQIKQDLKSTSNQLKEKNEDIEDLQNQFDDTNKQLTLKVRELKSLNSDLDSLEDELKALKKELDDKKNQIKELQEKTKSQSSQIKELDSEIDALKRKIKEKDNKLNDLQDKYEDVKQQYEEMDSQSTVFEEKNVYLQSEINTWKTKFIDLNKEYHLAQEELTMCKAELDNLRRETKDLKTVQQTSTTTQRTSVRGNVPPQHHNILQTIKQSLASSNIRDNVRESTTAGTRDINNARDSSYRRQTGSPHTELEEQFQKR